MYGEPPGWGTFTADANHVVRFTADDTGDVWTVTVGRFTGRSPDGAEHETACLDWVSANLAPTAKVSGSAADLDCWLWRRPPVGPVTQSGDEDTLARLAEVMADGVS
jgi:hypothetical protein